MTRWRHRTATALLLAAVPLAGLPGVAQAADPLVADACPADEVQGDWFADTAGNVHAQAVECLSWWAVTGGVEQGRYGVGDPVSRGQMATFLARTLDGLGVPLPGAEPRFPDVAGTTHADGISRLAAAGVVGGGADGRYRPGDPVSRAQMATFLVRTF
ncbi:MAG TPA: S-layer homology domain-containing protein, partial [Miltoncostaeaceae bacterium]|nr:S-layer homology domain-containing protein [Miltoncostaeaceae bacterium]